MAPASISPFAIGGFIPPNLDTVGGPKIDPRSIHSTSQTNEVETHWKTIAVVFISLYVLVCCAIIYLLAMWRWKLWPVDVFADQKNKQVAELTSKVNAVMQRNCLLKEELVEVRKAHENLLEELERERKISDTLKAEIRGNRFTPVQIGSAR
jgi:hypothetical protein